MKNPERQESKNGFRAAVVTLVLGLGATGMASSCTVYDNDPHPRAGVIVEHQEPVYDCAFNGKFTTCDWEYWIYIDGCGDLSEETVAQARAYDSDWGPEKGWLQVTPETWETNPDGTEVVIDERNFLGSVLPRNFAESCEDLQ